MHKAKRVRAALISMDGIIDVFVNKDIAFLLSKDIKLNEAKIAELLSKEKIEVQKLSKSDKYAY